MKTTSAWVTGALALGLVAGEMAVHAQIVADPEDAVAFLLSRNIFDPNRSPIREKEPAPRLRPVVTPPRVRTLVLTGSLVYPDKTLAFFSGSEPAYNRVIGPDETVGPWTVRRISTTRVELADGDEQVTLSVGRQLTQRGEEPWAVAVRSAPPRIAGSGATSTALEPDGSSPAADEPSDIMKRLMERRQKELSQ